MFGSATPRPESWAALERLELGGRIGADLPPVRVIDLRREAGYPLSAPLLRALRGVADRRGKAILLLNRRGVAPALHCRACGTTIRCPNCDVALVLHGDTVAPLPPLRPRDAGAVDVPGVRLARHRAPRRRHAEARARARARAAGARADPARRRRRSRSPSSSRSRSRASATPTGAVLLGTQMVAKGHHFAGVELAAVVDADTGLGLPDFRAEERTFQLITQLAGRSGRDAPGRVLVQTFQPDARPIAPRGPSRRRPLPRPRSSSGARRSATRRSRHLVRIVVTGPALEPVLRVAGGAEGVG